MRGKRKIRGSTASAEIAFALGRGASSPAVTRLFTRRGPAGRHDRTGSRQWVQQCRKANQARARGGSDPAAQLGAGQAAYDRHAGRWYAGQDTRDMRHVPARRAAPARNALKTTRERDTDRSPDRARRGIDSRLGGAEGAEWPALKPAARNRLACCMWTEAISCAEYGGSAADWLCWLPRVETECRRWYMVCASSSYQLPVGMRTCGT